jgi:pilus assembly protein CpaF
MPTLSGSDATLQAFELILPFISELEPYLADDEISDICINGHGSVYVERQGGMEYAGTGIVDLKKLMFALQRIARACGEEITDTHPSLDARLPDGSRIAALMCPYSVSGPTVTIRKFRRQYFSLTTLTDLGALSKSIASLLGDALQNRSNILISGPPGSGKTSLQNALLNELDPRRDRIIVIEESAEMQIEADNVTRFECRTNDAFTMTIRDLVKIALRHRPEHLVIGEIRGAEAMDLLDAMNTGNSGSMTTIHANSALSALTKLSNLALRAGADIPHHAIQAQIADVLTYVVQMSRAGERRHVTQVIQLLDYNHQSYSYEYDQIL